MRASAWYSNWSSNYGYYREIMDFARDHAMDIIALNPPKELQHLVGMGRDILRSVHDSLHAGGLFVAYQVRDRVQSLGREVFGRARVQTEILNVPPMRVYRWRKGEAMPERRRRIPRLSRKNRRTLRA